MDYNSRVASQIAQYAETKNMHELPEIFHFWTCNYLRPAVEAEFALDTIVDVYFNACVSLPSKRLINILSVGCGDGSIEIDLAKTLIAREIVDFSITGVDLSPILLQRFRKAVQELQLTKYFSILEIDLNSGQVRGPFDVIMTNHSLHHIVELEKLFEFSYKELRDDGIFATCDVIGRNGHMRWPETRAVIEMFWPSLKPKQRYHVLLKRLNETFVDHDCSTEGFEGIRAQDILPLLLQKFHPLKFVGAGGFIDLMIDRGYGHGFDVNDPDDLRLIKCMADLNEIMLDSGAIKPTLMFAHFVKYPCEETSYRGRTAIRSVRPVPPVEDGKSVSPAGDAVPQAGVIARTPRAEIAAPKTKAGKVYRRLRRSIGKRLA
jgi:SAM-dependent methyltransferase